MWIESYITRLYIYTRHSLIPFGTRVHTLFLYVGIADANRRNQNNSNICAKFGQYRKEITKKK